MNKNIVFYENHENSHSDFWLVSKNGTFYLNVDYKLRCKTLFDLKTFIKDGDIKILEYE